MYPRVSSGPSSNTTPSRSEGTIQVGENKFLTCELPSYGIKIDYPSNWTKVEEGLQNPLIVAFKSPREGVSDTFSESVTIAITYVPQQITLEQLMQLNINNFRNKNPDFKLLESTQTTLSGMPAHKIVYERDIHT